MVRAVTRVGLVLCALGALLACAAVYGGRVLRASAPEIAFIRGQKDVYVLDVDRGMIRHIAHTDLQMNAPRWSPDGRNLTYTIVDGTGNTGIERVNQDGRIDLLFRESVPVWSTAWSPDSRELAFIADNRLYLMNADGENPHQFYTDVNTRSYSLSWSPDGQNLAFIGDGSTAAPYIYLLNLAHQGAKGAAVTRIPANPQARPSWSPDSSQLAFVSGSGLYVANTDGSGERLVAATTIPRSSAWSPDGRLAFISNLQLFVTSHEGDIQPLPTGVRVDRSPAWSPDGSLLAFVSGGDLYVMSPMGGPPRLLTSGDDSRAITELAWRK